MRQIVVFGERSSLISICARDLLRSPFSFILTGGESPENDNVVMMIHV